MLKVTKRGGSNIIETDTTTNDQYEFISSVEEPAEDEGNSIAYVNINEIHEEDGDYFIEYVNEDDGNIISTDNNETEYEAEQYTEYTEDDDTNEELYNCNLCGMNFNSIEEHVQQYHAEEEVFVNIDDNDSVIKSELILESTENEDEGEGSLITADNTSNTDGELITYGDESIENENDILDEMTDDETSQPEIYTFDRVTGAITKATNVKGTKETKTANKTNVRHI